MKLQKKLLHIDSINNRHQKLIMLKRFMDYNKIIYTLKTTRIIDEWIDKIEQIYSYIIKTITAYVNYHPTMGYKISMMGYVLSLQGKLKNRKFSDLII